MNPNRPSGWASDALDLSKSAAAMPTGRSSPTRQMGSKPGEFIAKQASSGHFLKFSCFLDRSGTLIASPDFREAVRIGVALLEKPEPCRFQTSTPTGKGAGLGCNLPGRAPLFPVGCLPDFPNLPGRMAPFVSCCLCVGAAGNLSFICNSSCAGGTFTETLSNVSCVEDQPGPAGETRASLMFDCYADWKGSRVGMQPPRASASLASRRFFTFEGGSAG
jgi:hypothetical protein